MQPREKIKQLGVDALSDSELVALLIGTGIKGLNFAKVSQNLLSYIVKNISEAQTVDSLAQINGIGSVKASRVIAGMELGRRLFTVQNTKLLVSSSLDASRYFEKLKKSKQEQVRVLYMNGRFELIKDKLIALGGLNSVNVTPRDIIAPALQLNAPQFIVAHNHPTGDTTPSVEDIAFTKRLVEASKLVGVKMLDHIVLATDGWKIVPYE